MLAGKWTYRSFLNRTALVGDDAAAALALIFGEGVFEFVADGDDRFRGGLGMGTNYALTLSASVVPGDEAAPGSFAIVGTGIDGTPTAGWRYDYRGVISYRWPNAVAQIPCLLGTVIRVVAHGPDAPAGVTASFVAVRHSDDPPPRSSRTFVLMA